MPRRFTLFTIMLILAAVCSFPCVSHATPKKVFVSIAPQKYFVDAIGRDLVDTTVIVAPSRSPADYEPTPSQMMQMSAADIYFAVGVPFETFWLKKFSDMNPQMMVVSTDAKIEKKPIDRYEIIDSAPGHSEKAGHNHAHGVPDPHIWLAPALVKIQAGHILKGLIDIDPANAATYEKNHSRFVEQIERLDRELKALFTPDTRGKKFLVFHPSWGYFADAFGLEQISIEIAGKEPKAREVKQLIEYARAHGIHMVFTQPQFSAKHAEIIAAEIGGRVVFADPLAENWADNLRTVAISIKQALR